MRTRSLSATWAFTFGLALSPLVLFAAGCGTGGETTADCEVAIVGGGAGGLHTAYRLGATLGSKVCLIEKEGELGGRLHDISLDPKDPNSPKIGVGGRRVMETQDVLFALADELKLTLEKPPLVADLIGARGKYAFAKDDLRSQYSGLQTQLDTSVDYETWLYDVLRKGSGRASITNFSDLRSYIRATSGLTGYDFLHDMSRFRADFEYPLDARGYMDYLDEEWDVCCQASYPVGGMTAFIRGMEEKAKAQGVRFFKSQKVVSLDHNKQGSRYRVRSVSGETDGNALVVNANKLVVAISPYWLNQVGGDVALALKDRPEYKQIIGVKVVTITQWWPENWWDQIKDPSKTTDANVWRAWTTDHCLNFIEIPQNAYAVAAKATRSVYDDDIRCVQFWEELAKQGMPVLEAELQRQLTALFNNNGASTPATVNIPKPLKTHVQIWPDAWHWLTASATITNKDLANWAVQPLAGEDVGLVGEAYYVNRSGWSDGAYKSSIRLLNEKYGLKLGTTMQGLRSTDGGSASPGRRFRSDGGH
ncbi:MAG TPA: FAD-dependent oxidoreductase [Pseudomonadota bacterium]|nr:FAD-dependent oxidoreductase [Pseudomonadota bacterium]